MPSKVSLASPWVALLLAYQVVPPTFDTVFCQLSRADTVMQVFPPNAALVFSDPPMSVRWMEIEPIGPSGVLVSVTKVAVLLWVTQSKAGTGKVCAYM